ncbi:NADPH:quinone oxidoreductase family protein [soil metagenome]
MRAVLCKAYGPPETLILEDIEPPVAGPDEAVVAITAAALNFYDTLIIAGKYQTKPPLPFSPCGEFAGVVESVGARVTSVKPGERVMAYTAWNGAREKIAVAAHLLARVPDGLPDEVAAGLSVTYGTSLHALRDRGRLQGGETVAILGAAGGVGQAAIEIAKAMGARVIACASSDEKLAFCRSLGADNLINYTRDDLKTALKDLTGGNGVDVLYDPVGGDLAEPALRAMAWGGRYLVVGFAGGTIPRPPLNLVLLKGCALVGVFWGAHTAKEPARHRANMDQLLAWAAAGTIKPHIDKIYPLEEISAALGAIARREVKGKVIIRIKSR